MSSIDFDPDNLKRLILMRPFVSGQANINPVKRIKQLKSLLDTQSPKICIIRGEGIGDVLMTTPTLAALKELFPGSADIIYATNTRYLDGALVKVLKYNPFVDRVIDREEVDEGDYDLVVNLHCPCVSYEKRENPPKNRIDLFAEHTGVKLKDKLPKYYLQKEEDEWAKSFFAGESFLPTDKIITVHIFSTASRRNLDSYTFKQTLTTLANRGYKLAVITHTTDASDNIVFENIPNTIILKNMDIRKIAAIINNSNLVLCPDSSILHIAGALSIPTVSLFGHTDPNARINYYRNAAAIWPAGNMSCKCCWNLQCQMKNACYKAITSDMIVSACDKLIEIKRI